jgi:hypothetical protein
MTLLRSQDVAKLCGCALSSLRQPRFCSVMKMCTAKGSNETLLPETFGQGVADPIGCVTSRRVTTTPFEPPVPSSTAVPITGRKTCESVGQHAGGIVQACEPSFRMFNLILREFDLFFKGSGHTSSVLHHICFWHSRPHDIACLRLPSRQSSESRFQQLCVNQLCSRPRGYAQPR